ncbi:hypothetical protein EI42_05929 [Thermosporothrix hazakensis]|jgi:hypothetical protein|uniref:Uncharacterized protein n=1 Tax=Thermosporothrix hazakensis TaxID=644383 RepID=A0A326TWS5_THEHA|nr:hypothetical protein [Thermosporothrix hazakensis]PZW20556.1 hypothetical protein EI42_05929 [Thermosporothrix hazakensis]GCE51481.1 hypothetical protein KTH_63500 [Thermosporothrix hazakensis]
MRRFLPVLFLLIIAPVIAELLYGTVSITQASALLFVLPIYGAGALLIRELVRRSGRGWSSILLLGVAYGTVEEGLVLQSFFNPTLYGAAHWGARIFGINGVYVELQLVLHAVWSVAIPILLTELIFPSIRRGTPYLGRFGLFVTALFYVIGVLVLMFSTHVMLAPGYWAPPVLLATAGLAVLVLVVIALSMLPKTSVSSENQIAAPQPWIPFLVSGIGSFGYLALLIVLWRVEPAFAQWPLVLVPMLCALFLAITVARLVRHWSQASNWGDRHLLALASGALLAHTLVGFLDIQNTTTRLGLVVLGLIMMILLSLLALHIRHKGRSAALARSKDDESGRSDSRRPL